MTVTEPAALLRTEGLTKHFKIGSALTRHLLHAVDDVSLSVGEREIVALAGESGSGKSTIARLLAKIYQPTGGEIYFQGEPVSAIRSRAARLRYSGLGLRRRGRSVGGLGDRLVRVYVWLRLGRLRDFFGVVGGVSHGGAPSKLSQHPP